MTQIREPKSNFLPILPLTSFALGKDGFKGNTGIFSLCIYHQQWSVVEKAREYLHGSTWRSKKVGKDTRGEGPSFQVPALLVSAMQATKPNSAIKVNAWNFAEFSTPELLNPWTLYDIRYLSRSSGSFLKVFVTSCVVFATQLHISHVLDAIFLKGFFGYVYDYKGLQPRWSDKQSDNWFLSLLSQICYWFKSPLALISDVRPSFLLTV